MDVAIAEAKAKFSELVRRAEAGEEITITRHGKAVARFLPPAASEGILPRIGALRGQISIADDFDAPLEQFSDYMK